MVNALKNIAIGLVVFIVADQLIDALITDTTDTAAVLITTLVPLAIGIGVAIYAIVTLLAVGTSGKKG